MVALLVSDEYVELTSKLPANEGRSKVLHALIDAYELPVTKIKPKEASFEDMEMYHDNEYLEVLQDAYKLYEACEYSKLDEYGLTDDCPPFPELIEYVAYVAGASIQAATLLKEHRIVIHWEGGRHHAHYNRAAGYCYVNDIVLAIMELRKDYGRVMYIDLDVHHGDGVEEAFKTDDVMTVSFHLNERGFYPGTGNECEITNINCPLPRGCTDTAFQHATSRVLRKAYEVFKPDVLVIACGADGLYRDPVEGWSLSSRAFVSAIALLESWNLPMLVLGAGGYNNANTARCWVEVTALLCKIELCDDIPFHDYLSLYSPYCELRPKIRVEKMDLSSIDEVVTKVEQHLDMLSEMNTGSKRLYVDDRIRTYAPKGNEISNLTP